MHHEFKGAERVCHALEVVALTVSEVVHRVDVPFGACAMMRSLHHAVDDRVAEVHVRVRHVNLCAKHHLAFLDLARIHLVEELKRLLNRAVTVWTLGARLRWSAFLCGDLLRRLLVDICLATFYQFDCKIPKLLEIIGSIIFVTPLITKPLDVFFDGIHIFHVLFCRVGVVETQVANAAVVLGDAEIQADGLGVTNVEVAVRLRRETRLDSLGVLAVS